MKKGFTQSVEWRELRDFFEEEIEKLKKDIPYKDKDNDFIAKRYVALRETERLVRLIVRKVELSDKEIGHGKESFK